MSKAVSRNDPCPCGSGKKYKVCCLGKPPPQARRRRNLFAGLMALAGIAVGIVSGIAHGPIAGLSAGGAVLVVAAVIYIIRDPPPPQAGGSSGAASINFGK